MLRVDKLIRELGPKIADISEIEASDLHNLLLIRPLKGRAVTLKMGSKNFGLRYNNFLALADDLLERLPNGVIFDLRLEEQVVVGEDPSLTPPAAPAAAPVATTPQAPLEAKPVPQTVPQAAAKSEPKAEVKPPAKTKPAKASKKTEKKRRKNAD
jgi:hypothetical protein